MATNRNFSMVEYFKRRVGAVTPKHRFTGTSKEDFSRWQENLLADLHEALGPDPANVDLNPEIEWEVELDGVVKRCVVLDMEADYIVAKVLR